MPVDPESTAAVNEPAPAGARILPAGTRWAEFEIERVLSDSGSGLVYLATDHALEVPVAIKEYFPLHLAWRDALGQVHPLPGRDTQAWEAGLRAFIGEARLLARCEHPALVRVLRLVQTEGTARCVMPYVPGKRLSETRESPQWMPSEAQVLQVLDALLGALEDFHATGGVHGGVRPSNILLRPDGRPVLLGPGHASRATASDLVESLMARLEPSFAPPEVSVSIGGHAPGPWSDLYALAAVLRWWMTGMAPPPAAQVAAGRRLESMDELLRRLHGAWPQRPYPSALLEALDAALLPVPRERPRSVAEFRARLDGRGAGRRGAVASVVPGPVQAGGAAPPQTPSPPPEGAAASPPSVRSRPMPLDPSGGSALPTGAAGGAALSPDEALARLRATRTDPPAAPWPQRWRQGLVGAALAALFIGVWFLEPPAPSGPLPGPGLPSAQPPSSVDEAASPPAAGPPASAAAPAVRAPAAASR
jgi:serine/threonine protein kinase